MAFCGSCGNEVQEGASFCAVCGAEVKDAVGGSTPEVVPLSATQEAAPLLIGGVAVFIFCSIIQGIGGSSMFETRYYPPDNVILEGLMNLTFYPGWGFTIVLILVGIGIALQGRKSKDDK